MKPDEEEFDEGLEAIKQEFHGTWTCCGGIELEADEKCPICGERY